MSFFKKALLLFVTILVLTVLLAPMWMPLHPTTRAAYNIAEYRTRSWWWDQVGKPQTAGRSSLSGRVEATDGRPVADALVLVSTATGNVFTARADQDGWYAIQDIPQEHIGPFPLLGIMISRRIVKTPIPAHC